MKKLRMLTVLTLPALASPTLAADKVELIILRKHTARSDGLRLYGHRCHERH